MRKAALSLLVLGLLTGPLAEVVGQSAGALSTGSSWFHHYPTLQEYGVSLLEAPDRQEVGAQTTILLTVNDPEVELLAALWRPETMVAVRNATQLERSGRSVRVTVRFPESGEFRLSIAARRPNEKANSYRGVADWLLVADLERPAVPGASMPAASARTESHPPASAAASPADLGAALAERSVAKLRDALAAAKSSSGAVRASYFKALSSALFDTGADRLPETLRLLASAGLDPNLTDERGAPLLFAAIWNDRIDVARWLVSLGADVQATGRYGSTVLHIIATPMDNPVRDHVGWARFLIENGAAINARDESGSTPLAYAALSDAQHDLLVFFVEQGADINLGDEEGNAPLSHASQHECRQNTAYLRARGARLYSYQFPSGNASPACRAVLQADTIALASIAAGDLAEISGRSATGVPVTPLHLAAEQGSVSVVRTLVARGVDWNAPDRYGRTPLAAAVEAGRREIVSLLLNAGADPNRPDQAGTTPFAVACVRDSSLARMMLRSGVPPRGGQAGRAAIASGDIDLVRALGRSFDWSARDLQFAIDAGEVEITDYLSGFLTDRRRSAAQLVAEAKASRAQNEQYTAPGRLASASPSRGSDIEGKRGNFPYVLESWSPWLKNDAVKSFAEYPVGLYVPKEYDGSKPYGLVISMSNAKSSSPYPRSFEDTLDRHNLIWVGFDPYNGLSRLRGNAIEAFCLALVYNMLGHFNVDRSRIYIGGFSLGGQLTEAVLRFEPRLFTGAFFINIGFTAPPASQPQWHYLRDRVAVVFVEGDYDYNRLAVYRAYDELLTAGFRDARFLQEAMIGHRLISADSFERAIQVLESANQ